MCMWVFIGLFGCLLIRVSLCFLGWLVVSMCFCMFFGTLQYIFVPCLHFGKRFCAFLVLWGALGLHCNTWGSTLPALVNIFA